MMKLTRSSLKALIKECIVEVLASGIGDSSLSLNENNVSRSPSVQSRQRRSRNTNKILPNSRKALDNIRFDKTVNESVSTLTQDPVMQSIFSDTAKTTLQDQFAHSNTASVVPAGADRAQLAAANSDPSQLFEGSNNWAQLAFMDTKITD